MATVSGGSRRRLQTTAMACWCAWTERRDPHLGLLEVAAPLDVLRRDGYFRWRGLGEQPYTHSYLKLMGIEAAFEIEFELVNAQGSMDIEFDYEDRERPEPGDYYYLRMEQLDTNKGWASPVWIN